ncbi:uncharacterized protein LOC125758642 [Rhipicephalus sanguineus]|uniref:uncharacterized protein LOC125758642 n=1 Tax=Rhipicephalus sanguineus TaxID=34632 RepID=UPI0020C3FAE2|nr:uncharacterized protein LOC125758642 [Rhipicephalus sanguineus]
MPVSGIGEYRLGTSASWDEYVERLEMYCEANKLSKDEEKRAVLLSSCGEETYSLIVTLVKPERPTAAAYEKIKKAVREHMHPKPSVLCGRFLFYKRNQAQGESVADYVTALRRLAENCGFGDDTLPMDEMMRDRFVFGISNEAVQQRLLAERDLTFTVAYDMAVTAEATQRQQREIRTQSLSDANCIGDAALHETRPKEPAASRDGVCYRCNGSSVGDGSGSTVHAKALVMETSTSSKYFITVEIAWVTMVSPLEAAFEVGLMTFGADVEVAWAAVRESESKGAWTASLGTEEVSTSRAVESVT